VDSRGSREISDAGPCEKEISMRTRLMCLPLVLLAGCATSGAWLVSADRSSVDRTVKIAQETEELESFQVDARMADRLAMRQCERAGYSGVAETSGTRLCITGGSNGSCERWQVEREYRCTGETKASSAHTLASTLRMDPYAAPPR